MDNKNSPPDQEKAVASPRRNERNSVMSYEDPPSRSSSSRDSISTASSHHYDRERYNRDFPEKTLTPHLSRASSTSAVGGVNPIYLSRTRTNATTTTTDPAFEIDFEENEKGNPMTWPLWYKGFIIAVMSYATTCVVLYSTSYTSAIPGLIDDWGISRNTGILGVTTYLLGMACGSVVLAPLSEMYGRRPVYIIALGLFVIFVLPCALAQNIATILVFRFIGAFCAAAMISNAPGTVNDISDEEHRALAFSIWSIGPMNGESTISMRFMILTDISCRTCHWTRCWRVRFPVHGLAVDELDRCDSERRRIHCYHHDSGNIRTSDSPLTRGEAQKRDRRTKILESL